MICTLADRDGQPLDGATVDVVAFSHARGSDRTAVTLLPAGSGRYEAPVRFTRAGVWEFRLAIQRGPDTFTYVEQRDVYPPTGSQQMTAGRGRVLDHGFGILEIWNLGFDPRILHRSSFDPMAALIAVLLASLFGSLHCAGMCGPLVAFAVGTPETRSYAQRAVLQIAYHGGRLATYALVGAICGVLGAALDLGGSLLGLQRVAAVLAGAMMIAVGVLALLRYRGVTLPHVGLPAFLQRLVVVGQRAAVGLRPLPRALAIGLLTALLPCGWLYAFAIIAAGAGSAAGARR